MDREREREREGERERDASERSPACASCKHQRKKCGKDCMMAPFFPAEKDSSFKEVHKLFGVSNIQKMIERLKKEKNATDVQVTEAIDAIKWVASWWERDPIRGCYGEYKRLEDQFSRLQRQVSQCGFCGQAPLQHAPQPQYNGWARMNGNDHHHYHHTNHQTPSPYNNGNNTAIVSGYLDCNRNLNHPQIQIGSLSFVPGLEAQVEAGPGPYGHSLDKQIAFPQSGFLLPRTAVTSSPLTSGLTNATYYHHLQDPSRSCLMQNKKTEEEETTWGGSSLP